MQLLSPLLNQGGPSEVNVANPPAATHTLLPTPRLGLDSSPTPAA